MVRKGKLAVSESSNISETGKTMLTKIGVHGFDIIPHLHEFFELILFDQYEFHLYEFVFYIDGRSPCKESST